MLSTALILSLPFLALTTASDPSQVPATTSAPLAAGPCAQLPQEATDACELDSEGLAPAAASYLASVYSHARVSKAMDAIQTYSWTQNLDVDFAAVSGVLVSTDIVPYLQIEATLDALATQLPDAQRARVSNVLGKVLSLNVAGATTMAASAVATPTGIVTSTVASAGSMTTDMASNDTASASMDAGSSTMNMTNVDTASASMDAGSATMNMTNVDTASASMDAGSATMNMTNVDTASASMDAGSATMNMTNTDTASASMDAGSSTTMMTDVASSATGMAGNAMSTASSSISTAAAAAPTGAVNAHVAVMAGLAAGIGGLVMIL